MINISKQSYNEKKEEEPINLQSIKQNEPNDYNSGELEEKLENNLENENKELKLENYKIPKKEMPSSKIENKTRNVVNDLAELNNDNNATNNMNNNTIQTKSNQIENNNNDNNVIIENYSQKSEKDEFKNQEEIQEENKEEYKEDKNKEKNLNINDINHKSNAIELNIYTLFLVLLFIYCS